MEVNKTKINWTKEQLEAINTRNCNLLVAAAAGSGKTAVLVERIIKMISDEEAPIDIDELLVVTFTNAAASEMKEKIGNALYKALEDNPKSMKLQRQISLLGKASITTIHSFCLQVIKNNIHLLDVDPSFRISDNTEAILLKQESINNLFDELYEKKGDNQDFLTLVDSYCGDRDDLKLQNIVLDLFDFVMSGPWPDKWLVDAYEAFNVTENFKFENTSWCKVFFNGLRLDLQGLIAKLGQGILLCDSSSGLEPYKQTLLKDLELLTAFTDTEKQGFDALYKFAKEFSFETIKRCGKGVDKEVQESIKAIRDGVKKEFNTILAEAFTTDSAGIKAYMRKIYPSMKCLCHMVIEFQQVYSAMKREKNILDFNDLEHLCLKLLTKSDQEGNITPSEVALIYKKKFKEILVDEYQDSNKVQEFIFNMIESDKNSFFMVGDVKQSIYRFRQAEPAIFLRKYYEFPEEAGQTNRKILLFKNFRSREEIINGVNFIFKAIMSKELGELEYDDSEALKLGAKFQTPETINSAKYGGPIEVNIIEKGKEAAALIQDNDDEKEELDSMELEGRFIAKRINELINGEKPFLVWDKNKGEYRNAKYSDIVILLRATSRWAEAISKELTKHDIPIFSDAGTGYFETIEVKTIINLLQIIDNPRQDIPLLAVLRSPIFGFTPEELIDIRVIDNEKGFYELLKEDSAENKKVENFLLILLDFRKRSKYMPIDELIWYIYTKTSYLGYVSAMPNGIQRRANLKILFQRARQFQKTSYKGLFNFVNFIERLRNSSGDMGSAKILGENENVVRIMSIHKSKGLEFPIVFLSAMGKGFNKGDIRSSILFHNEMGIGPDFIDASRRISYSTIMKNSLKRKITEENLSEEMRVLYVAMTRAKEKLIITGCLNKITEYCIKWCDDLYNRGSKVPVYNIMKGKSYFDWVGYSIAKHAGGNIIRERAGINEDPSKLIKDASLWDIFLWERETVEVLKGQEDEVKEEYEIAKSGEELINKFISKSDKNSSFDEIIESRLNWKYKYQAAVMLPSKISVSEVKRIDYQESLAEEGESLFVQGLLEKPRFLSDTSLSAAQKGTALHSVLQHLNLDKLNSIDEIKEQTKNFLELDILTREEEASINIKKVYGFFNSPFGLRLLNSNNINREAPFYIPVKSSDIYKNLLIIEGNDESIILQGIIDCYFEEEDGLVLVDYKTDYISGEELTTVSEKYAVQIEYYAKALERITGKKVKESYLYLFNNETLLKM